MLVETCPVGAQAVENLPGARVIRVDLERLLQLLQALLGTARLDVGDGQQGVGVGPVGIDLDRSFKCGGRLPDCGPPRP